MISFSDWLPLLPAFSGCGLGWFLSVAVIRCYWCFFPQYFHGNCSVWGLILRSVWEWRRMKRNRTLNTVRTPRILFEFAFFLNGRRNGNNDCRRCRGCGPHGRNAVVDPFLFSSLYRSYSTFCVKQFLRFFPVNEWIVPFVGVFPHGNECDKN